MWRALLCGNTAVAEMAYSGAFHPEETREPAPQAVQPLEHAEKTPHPKEPLGGAVSALMKKLESIEMETDDLIMALILYLMYRESGDKDLLIMLGAMFLS